ncbi:MAG: hypothetical protein AVDCRST_MAG67-293, partial [uncultured Solirubrobacteraceae bacterium]
WRGRRGSSVSGALHARKRRWRPRYARSCRSRATAASWRTGA